MVVDDHKFMRELISARLSRERPGYNVVAQVGDASSAIAACQHYAPDLVVLDINLPDRSGIEVVPEVKRVSPSTSILLCTAYASEDCFIDAIRSGAEGFVEKTNTWDDFIDVAHRVSDGERCFRSSCATTSKGSSEPVPPKAGRHAPPLTGREREVLALIAHGSTSKEIAAKLFISVKTVETHRASLLNKLRVRNVADLAIYAAQNGLVDLTRPAA